jgi:hypothetical protein
MNRLVSHFGRLLVLLVFLAAAWLLYDRLKEYTFGQIREAIAAMPTWHIVAASLLTVLNYVILIGYVFTQEKGCFMDRRTFVKTVPALAMMAGDSSVFAEELQPIVLPKPEKEGGKSVLAALWERRTTREIKEDKLPPQVLSNLLRAAFGVNREAGPMGLPGRTAASASDSQEHRPPPNRIAKPGRKAIRKMATLINCRRVMGGCPSASRIE